MKGSMKIKPLPTGCRSWALLSTLCEIRETWQMLHLYQLRAVQTQATLLPCCGIPNVGGNMVWFEMNLSLRLFCQTTVNDVHHTEVQCSIVVSQPSTLGPLGWFQFHPCRRSDPEKTPSTHSGRMDARAEGISMEAFLFQAGR